MYNLEDKKLYRIAKDRANFKRMLLCYTLVNTFLWCVYLFTNNRQNDFPWPLFVMFGWGIGLAISYAKAYHKSDWFSTEKEYEKLRGKFKV